MPAPFAMPFRGSCVALWGPAAVCAGWRRPAREIATREPAARSGRSRGPPWPCRHPPAPRPGPAAAHGRRSQALLRPPAPSTSAVLCRLRVAGCVGSLSGQAPPPPTGTAARPSCALRRPPRRRCCVACVWLGASARCPARPRRRPRVPQPGPAVPPAPSTSAALAVWRCCSVPAISHVIPLGLF